MVLLMHDLASSLPAQMSDNDRTSTYASRRKSLLRQPKSSGTEGEEAFPLVHFERRSQTNLPGEEIDTYPSTEWTAGSEAHNKSFMAETRRPNSDVSEIHTSSYDYEDPHNIAERKALGDPKNPPNHATMWNPKWLDLKTLLGFCALFCVVLVGLLLLYYFSEVNHGLSTQISSNHYAWTYGPTAILVLVTSAWRQVDFCCRILAPWKHLTVRATSPERSLLLDYISPILPSRLWSALHHRDWDVAACTFAVVLLRTLTILSTGLLVLTPTTMLDTGSNLIVDSDLNANTLPDPSFSEGPLMTYYGILTEGLDMPYGTTASAAYSTLNLSFVRPNSTITATLDGLFPHFDCEISPATATSSIGSGTDDFGLLWLNVTVPYPPCGTFSIPLPGYDGGGICQPADQTCPSPLLVLRNTANLGYEASSSLEDDDPCAHLWLFIAANLTYELEEHPENSTMPWNVTVGDPAAVVCASSYSFQPVNVTITVDGTNTATDILVTPPSIMNRNKLEYLSFGDFDTLLDYVFLALNAPIPHSEWQSPQAQLLGLQNGNSPLDAFLDAETLRNTVSRTLQGVGAQAAHFYMTSPTAEHATGITQYEEQRLQVRSYIVWLMVANMCLLILCVIVVLIFRPLDVVPRDPNSIASMAAVLTSVLVKPSTVSDANPWSSMKHLPTAVLQKDDPHDMTRNSTWWRPMSVTFIFMALAIILPLTIIIVLEVLQRLSDASQGFAAVSPGTSVGHTASALLASLVMTATTITFDSIEFAAATFAPYQALLSGKSTAARCLLKNSLGEFPVVGTVTATRNRHFGLAIASAAALVASTLSILSSGLYTVQTIASAPMINVVGVEHFTQQWNSSNDNGAHGTFALIEHRNATYPLLTYDELALPRFRLPQSGLTNTATDTSVQVALTARRGSLNCTIVPVANTTVVTQTSANASDGYYAGTLVNFVAGKPAACPGYLDPLNNITSSIPFSFFVGFSNNNASEALVGGTNDAAHFWSDSPDPLPSIRAVDNAPECPSLVFYIGKLSAFADVRPDDFTALVCVQGLEDVQANVTFQLPGMKVSPHQPPLVDEASAKWIASENYDLVLSSEDYFEAWQINEYLDGFMQTVLWGRDGVPSEELLGASKAERFIDAVQHVYRQYMAQVISLNMREDVPLGSPDAPIYAARFPDSATSMRLQQDRRSKLALQALLGALILCAVAVYAIGMDMRHTLKECPWSLAGTMRLLTGSELCTRRGMPVGAEFMSQKQMAEVLSGWQFSLGWWAGQGGEGGGERRFGIDVGQAMRAGEGSIEEDGGKAPDHSAQSRDESRAVSSSVDTTLPVTNEADSRVE